MRFKRLRILFNKVARRKELDFKLKSVNVDYEADTIAFRGSHPAAAKIVEELVWLFIDSGATNYLELNLFNPADMHSYTVLIQRNEAITPAEVNTHLRHALEQIEKGVGDPKETAVSVLRQMGYAEPLKVRPRPPAGGLL